MGMICLYVCAKCMTHGGYCKGHGGPRHPGTHAELAVNFSSIWDSILKLEDNSTQLPDDDEDDRSRDPLVSLDDRPCTSCGSILFRETAFIFYD